MSIRALLIPIVCILVFASACSPITSELTATKAFPENNTAPVKKVLVVAISDNVPVRNLLEQEIKKRLKKTGVEAMGSLDAMPFEAKIDKEAFETYFKAQQITHILVLRLVDQEKMAIYAEGQEYSGTGPRTYWAGYYDYYYQMYDRTSEPGHFQEATLLMVESNLFAVNNSEVIWTSSSKSFHRDNARDIIDDLSKLIVNAMKEDGILK
jgi:hypothetical protein